MDTTSVLGYTCSKAICDFEGRSYSAWFTQDIPINDGPYKFFGLPGMILKIEDSENFSFVANRIRKMENAEIVIDDKSKYQKCTKEEYKRLKKRMQENFTVFYRRGEILYFCNQKNGIEYMPIEKRSTENKTFTNDRPKIIETDPRKIYEVCISLKEQKNGTPI